MSTIARVQTYLAEYPVTGRFKFFAGASAGAPRQEVRATVVVKLTDDEGTIGWGQSVPSPRWSYETLETVASTIDVHLAPAIMGCDPFDVDRIHAKMNRAIAPSFSTGQPIAKAGIDLALFDLTGRRLGQSAAQRWGRQGRSDVELSWTLNPSTLDELESQVATAFARGYRHFNLKVAPDLAFDLDVCRKLRELAPDSFAWVDANGGYDLQQALAAAPRFADLGMAAFEQPLAANRLSGLAQLRRQRALPIVLDEPLVSKIDLEEFLALDLMDGVAIKVSRCGGLTEARRMIELALERGLLFFGSGLTDPDLSLAASVALFAAYDLERPAALNGPQFLSGTILREPLIGNGSRLAAPTGPGLGVDVDEQALQLLAARSH